MSQVFDAFDADGSGSISRSELLQLLNGVGASGELEGQVRQGRGRPWQHNLSYMALLTMIAGCLDWFILGVQYSCHYCFI